MDYAILVSLSTREEAEVVASALRADGVDAFVGDTNHLGMNWFYTIALGGLQILVPRNRLGDAREMLRERIRENLDAHPDDRVQRRDRWKIFLLFVWVVLPAAIQLTVWFAGIAFNAWDGNGWLGPGVNRPSLDWIEP